MPDRLTELSVTSLKGVGPRLAQKLARLNIRTVQDVLFHLPVRYEDRTRIAPIGSLRPGVSASVVGEVQITQVRFGRRRSLVSMVSDGTGRLLLRLFHFNDAQRRALRRGARIHCFGDVRIGPAGPEMIHPEYRLLGGDARVEVEAHLTPTYPATEGLHQLRLRKMTDEALALMAGGRAIADYLPLEVSRELGLPMLREALEVVHRPPPDVSIRELEEARHPARRRLAFEELLSHHLSLRLRRDALERQAARPLVGTGTLSAAFRAALGFSLTPAQVRVIGEIGADLERAHPMHRLLQGDVGSGKTVVAAMAALQALEAGSQVAFMAPTEILAEQHRVNLSAWLEPLGVEVGWISSKLAGKPRATMLEALRAQHLSLVVGTHALFQEPVEFANLGLVIVDEQHRFGVHQRLALLGKGRSGETHPHQLIMTATPIPRTLAMAAYADLDTSVIDTLPPGRQPIETAVVPESRRAEVVERVLRACQTGQQAYWVCTLIEESEALQCQAATDTAASLVEALPELRVGLVHGRLKGGDKEVVMRRFKDGEIDLLVATTVIEVGVDVPKATLMIIENAERLGLAQLHQLRGRVGRGDQQSVCVLLYRGPLSEHARDRLNALRETTDGFEIARRDLALRGPGEILGTRQTGLIQFRVADLMRDQTMFPDIERTASRLLREHRDRVPPLIKRWLGDAVDYVDV